MHHELLWWHALKVVTACGILTKYEKKAGNTANIYPNHICTELHLKVCTTSTVQI